MKVIVKLIQLLFYFVSPEISSLVRRHQFFILFLFWTKIFCFFLNVLALSAVTFPIFHFFWPAAPQVEMHFSKISFSSECAVIFHFSLNFLTWDAAGPTKSYLIFCNKWLSGWNHLYIVTSSHEPTSGHVSRSYSKKRWKTHGRDQ